MFTPRDEGAIGQATALSGGPASAAARLSHDQVVPESAVRVLSRINGTGERLQEFRARVSARLSGADLAPDLAQDIGSIRWFRGVGTFFALAALALLFWPNFSAVEAAPPMRIDDVVRDEFRSQMIMPLALGGDSGSHMAATAAVVPLKAAPERPQIELVATLAQGDSFARMLQRAGIASGEIGHITGLVASAMPLGQIEPGTKVDIVLGRRPAPGEARPLDSLKFRARFDLELGLERRGGALALVANPIRVDATPLRIRGRVGASLYRSARAAGAPAKAVQQYLRALNDQLDLDSAIAPGDEFDIILAYKRAATGETEVGELLYAGVIRGGKARTQLMRWGRDGLFYEASGVGEQRSGLFAPVPGRIISGFGMRRHPILGYTRLHAGLDFKASYGSPIYAASDGVVVFAGRHGGHGNFVKIDHGGGLATGYAHMSSIAVRTGERVHRGEVIGYVGSTGLSTGPHLHYELYRGGRTVDPRSVQFVTRAQLSGRDLADFRATLAQLLTVTPGAALVSLVPARDEIEVPAREIDRAARPREIG